MTQNKIHSAYQKQIRPPSVGGPLWSVSAFLIVRLVDATNKLVLILQVNHLNVKFISPSFPCLFCYSYSVMRREKFCNLQQPKSFVGTCVLLLSLCNKPSCRQVCLCVVRSIHQHLLMLLHSFCHLFNQCSDFL